MHNQCFIHVSCKYKCNLLFQYKLGKTLIQLAFNLQAWMECGGDNSLGGEEAIEEARTHIDRAIGIFKEVGNTQMLKKSS